MAGFATPVLCLKSILDLYGVNLCGFGDCNPMD